MDKMNVSEKIDALLANEYILGVVNKEKEKKNKTYRPTKKTIDKHGEVNLDPEIGNKIGRLSVFKSYLGEFNDDYLADFCKMFFQFTQSQINNMNEEKKRELLEVALEGMMKTIKVHRNKLLPYNTYLPGEYEHIKLKVLMKSGKEPILMTEENYVVLEGLLKELLYEASRKYLSVEDEDGRELSALYLTWEKQKLGEMAKNFLKETGYNDSNLLDNVRTYYLKHGHNLNQEQIEEFQGLPICPFTGMLDNESVWSKQQIVNSLFDVFNRSYIWNYLTKENLEKIIKWTIILGESYVKSEEKRKEQEKSKLDEFQVRQLYNALKEFKEMTTRKE